MQALTGTRLEVNLNFRAVQCVLLLSRTRQLRDVNSAFTKRINSHISGDRESAVAPLHPEVVIIGLNAKK